MNFKKEIIIIFIALGITSLALVFIFIVPFLEGIKESSSQLVEVKRQLASFENKIGSVEKFETTYENITEDLIKANNLLINPDVPIEFIEFLEATAKYSDVSINIYPYALKVGESDRWDSIGFNLILVGSFANFMRFLEKIESAYYLIEIQNLLIKKPVKQEGFSGDDVTVNLKIKVFVK